MATLDFSQTQLEKLITHKVGNKLREEELILSDQRSEFSDETVEYLMKYFLHPFKNEELFNFTHTSDLQLNEVFNYAGKIFESEDSFISASKEIAKILYEYAVHPKINEGELNVAFFSDVIIGGEVVDAIGLFKSETSVPFLRMRNKTLKFAIEHEFGFELKGIDKGCIIFNTNQQNGFIVMAVDNTNKSNDAQYWKNDFLKIKPMNNEYRMTAQVLNITKDFAAKQFVDEFQADKADQIDLLNRSVSYFKTHEAFDKNEFEEEVLKDQNLIDSFRKFDKSYRVENDVNLNDNFEISSQAVKKQARALKSVLKLDKNFHIYIHGDREQIEKGTDSDGRKFYKIYYDKEE